MIYVATVVKGLEEVCTHELEQISKLQILQVESKTILFSYDGEISNLENLKTIDDIGIFLSELSFEQFMGGEFHTWDESFNLALAHLGTFREINEIFSITIGRYKNANFSEDSIKENLSKFITKEFGLKYNPLDHSNIDLKIILAEERVLAVIKLFPESLYKRKYGHKTVPGSLRSTVAAAMVYLLKTFGTSKPTREGKLTNAPRLIDSFCGSGTLLCEAATQGFEIYGGDIKPERVEISIKNLHKSGSYGDNILCADAIKTNWGTSYFDAAISNLPWGKIVKVSMFSTLLDGAFKEYSRILKPRSKVCFITNHPEKVMATIRRTFMVDKIRDYKIGYLGQTPTIIVAEVRKESGLYL
jgi:23S rRNA G2445 N2-methylase RlmL